MMFRHPCMAVLVFIAGSVAVSAQEKNPECVRQGKDLFAEKKYKEAVRVLEKCGNEPSAWETLGLAYFELSYMDDAK
jgi:Flp pilus assembly protein TadD